MAQSIKNIDKFWLVDAPFINAINFSRTLFEQIKAMINAKILVLYAISQQENQNIQ